MYLVFILDALNLHLSGGVEDIHVKDGYIGIIKYYKHLQEVSTSKDIF